MTRLTIYFIVTVGLGLMELFRSKIGRGETWGLSAEHMFGKMGLYVLIFVGIELVYSIIRLVLAWRKKKQEQEKNS